LRELAADRPGRLLINSAPADVHCKLLLIDGLSAVVSSFEFLHFMNSQEYIRHELGVWVGSAPVTGAIVAGLVAHVEGSDNAFAAELRALVDDHERAKR